MKALLVVSSALKLSVSLSTRSIIENTDSVIDISSLLINRHFQAENSPWRIELSYGDRVIALHLHEIWEYNATTATEGYVYCHSNDTPDWQICGDARISLMMIGEELTTQGVFNTAEGRYQLYKKKGKYQIFNELSLSKQYLSDESRTSLYDEQEIPLMKRGLSDAPNSAQDAWPNFMDLKEIVSNGTSCYNTRYLAPIGVAADSNFINSFESPDAAQLHIIDTVNKASQVWENAFNISLMLSDLIMGGTNMQYSWNVPCNSSDNTVKSLENRLSELKVWREASHPNDGLALWSLFSNCPSSDVIGLAWQSMACQPSGVNILHHSVLDYQILAHESGHVFGAVHDCVNTTCTNKSMSSNMEADNSGLICCPYSSTSCDSNGAYIMSPGSEIFQQSFSKCTQANVCSAIKNSYINSSCLVRDNYKYPTSIQAQTSCNSQADPIKYRKCWRDVQCKSISNGKSISSCGSVYDCTLSCLNSDTEKCEFHDVPLVYQAVWGWNDGITNNSCIYPYSAGTTVTSNKVPNWGWAIIGLGGLMIVAAVGVFATVLLSRRHPKEKSENTKKVPRKGEVHKRKSRIKSQIRIGFPIPHREVFNRDPITGIPPVLPYNTSPKSTFYPECVNIERESSLEQSSTSSSMYSRKSDETKESSFNH